MSLKIPWDWLLLATLLFFAGVITGVRFSGSPLAKYVQDQAEQTAKVTDEQVKVITKTEIVYRDRIKKVYVKGDVIEKLVPEFVTSDDDSRYGVNVGFVRIYDAAWSGEDPRPPTESDRGPAAISLAEISAVDTHNATSCLAWREIALGTRAAYQGIQAAINGPAQ